MGTKGRDALLWMFFALMSISVLIHMFAKTLFVVAALDAALFLNYCTWERHNAVRKCREMGMNIVVLLPMNLLWTKILLSIDGDAMGRYSLAYEVHVKGGKQNLSDYLKTMAFDLDVAASAFPGAVFIWETSAPLPLSIRRLVRQGLYDGSAFLKDGGWPIPRFPFMGRYSKKGRLRHGAIVSKGGTSVGL